VTRVVLFALLLALFGALVFRSVSYAADLLRYPYEWDEDEGYAILYAQRLLGGKPIYVDFNALPMTSSCYPPVYPAVVALLVPRFGATLIAGRLVSVAALGALVMLVAAAVRQETGRWGFGALAAAMVLGSPHVATWGPLSRLDSLMMFFVLAGLLLVRQFPRYRPALPAGLFLLLLACYTKYQAVVLALPAFWHVWRVGRRASVVAIAAFGLAGLAVLAGLLYWSDGRLWQSTVAAQATEYTADNLRELLLAFLSYHAILVAIAFGWVAYQIVRRDVDLWGALALASIPMLLLAGKRGASINYFMPSIVASAICAAVAMHRLTRRIVPDAPAEAWRSIFMFTIALQAFIWWLDPLLRPTTADRESGDRIMGLVRRTQGDILTERRIMFSLLAGREPPIDACMLSFVYGVGREKPPGTDAATEWEVKPGARPLWNPAAMVQAIKEKRFPLIILAPPVLFPPEIVRAIEANYRLLQEERIIMGNWHGRNEYVLLGPA
ncbi:MAG: ArnT family glycosyltransferase, partial [Phycisphaerae bacterium]